ncbi:MAG: low temperature requirement protein A [Actinomycetota bacterium]
MKDIEVPERSEDFTADPVELFFDLAYVFAFSQLVGRLVDEPTWIGVGRAALLFGLLWLPWQQLTWAANAVSGNGRAVRLIFLVATAASVPMAAATSTALTAGGPVFAVTLGVIMALGFLTQMLGVKRGSAFHRAVVRWVAPNAVALAVLIGGSLVEGRGRIVLWLLSLAIVLGAMIAAGRGDWIIRSGHFAERHGLIVIIALGEVVVAIGAPVVRALEEGEGLPGARVVALLASGVFAGLLWWAYFDRVGPALEHRAERIEGDVERGRFVRDVYTWAHAPIVAGVVLAAAGLDAIAEHPNADVALAFRAMLLGGLVLGVVGISAAVWRAFHAVARERIVAAVPIGALLLLGGSVNGAVLLVTVDVFLAAMLLVEHTRIER